MGKQGETGDMGRGIAFGTSSGPDQGNTVCAGKGTKALPAGCIVRHRKASMYVGRVETDGEREGERE